MNCNSLDSVVYISYLAAKRLLI